MAVVGAKDRETNTVVASTDKETPLGFAKGHAAKGAKVYTPDATAHGTLPFDHDFVKRSLQEYDKGDVRTNGIESLRSMLKRAAEGTFHKLGPKHLNRCVQAFAGRHDIQEQDTVDELSPFDIGMKRKRQRYKDLIKANDLASVARAAWNGPPGTSRNLH